MEEQALKFLLSASGFELERIKTALSDNGIPNDSRPQKRNYSAKAVTGVDNMSIQDIFVAEEDYDKAFDLCVGIGAIKLDGEEQIIEEETPAETGVEPAVEEAEEMSSRKRIAIRVVSALLFVLLVAAVIFGTDFFTNWIKNFFM